MNEDIKILKITPQKDYELLDGGEGEKLERFGAFVLRRPDPQALWPKKLSKDVWEKSDAFFVHTGKNGKWNKNKKMDAYWSIALGDLNFKITLTPFKHTGIFPEQLPNWEWMEEKIKSKISNFKSDESKEINVLNLFGYTGGATLACLKAGAKVTHVDASKASIAWAKENAKLSGLSELPVRWILDDALEFVKKEVKRGKKYDAVVMDPPAFGRSPTGKVWKLEEGFSELFENVLKVLADKPLFVLVNGYASGYSSIAYKNNLGVLVEKFGGKAEAGELTIEESVSKRLLPAGIFARWYF